MAQQKMCEAEAVAEAKNWEQRNSEFACREIIQEFEAQRFQLHQASRWAGQAERENISLYGELELRNRVCHETMQGNAKKLKNREEFVAKKLIKQDMQELSNCPCQIRELQNEVNSLSDAREFFLRS